MDNPSVHGACHSLITTAIQRCRRTDRLCRITIAIKHPHISRKPSPSTFQISISDTGPGIKVTDLQDVNCCFRLPSSFNGAYVDPVQHWDGVLKIATTDYEEDEVRYYKITVGATGSPSRLTPLQSSPKARGTFSGTEASLFVQGSPTKVMEYINDLCQKISILKMATIILELCLEHSDGSQSGNETLFMSNEGIVLPKSMSNIDRLSDGIVDYMVQYVHGLGKQSEQCCPFREAFRVGKGLTCSMGTADEMENVFEAVLVVLEMTEATRVSNSAEHGIQTKVLYYEDFCPSTVTVPVVEALSGVDWLKYGLTIESIQVDRFGHAIIEWEGMQTIAQFYVALHKYQKKCLKKKRKMLAESIIVKDAVGIALEELKEKNPERFLSKHAKKMQTYAPDLSRAISGLVMSSNDGAFKEECASILGLLATDLNQQVMESFINNKIFDIIKMTDKNPSKINASENAEDTVEEQWNKEQEDENDNEDSLDEPRSLWDDL